MSLIFLSYRRDDVSGHAARVYTSLSDTYTSGKVFFDSDHIGGAERWSPKIQDAISTSLAFVCIIGPRWNPDRLHNEDDYVRRELRAAQSRGKPIIPLLFDGARPPSANELPEDCRSLLDHQWVFFDPSDFGAYEAKMRTIGDVVYKALENLVAGGDAEATCTLSLDVQNNKGKDELWFRLTPPDKRIYIDIEQSAVHSIKFPVGWHEIKLEKYLAGASRSGSGRGSGKTVVVASYQMFFEAGNYTARVERYEFPFPLNHYDRHKFGRPVKV